MPGLRRSRGVVVQAVLLTVMVMAIGLLAVASRVYSSREGAAASSLQAAAQQAAEFGFSEIVAEMNRDRNNYTWVTCSGSWSSISDAELTAKGIYVAPGGRSTIFKEADLPEKSSDGLSYRLDGYVPPPTPVTYNDPDNFCRDSGPLGNTKGGSGTLTIDGTARRGNGDTTTYRLKRTVSVGPWLPFQESLLASTPVETTAADPRFPSFPPVPSSLPVGPALICGAGTGNAYSCTDGSSSYDFNNASQQKFPYVIPGSGLPTLSPFCQDSDSAINCRLASLEILDAPIALDLIVTATQAKPVNLFIDGSIDVNENAKFCSHSDASAAAANATNCADASGDWQMLRIYGRNTGASCPPSSQTVTLNSIASPTADSGKLNVQNAFLWFPEGRLEVGGSITASKAALRGWICAADPKEGVPLVRIWPEEIFPPPLKNIILRGFGSRDLSS